MHGSSAWPLHHCSSRVTTPRTRTLCAIDADTNTKTSIITLIPISKKIYYWFACTHRHAIPVTHVCQHAHDAGVKDFSGSSSKDIVGTDEGDAAVCGKQLFLQLSNLLIGQPTMPQVAKECVLYVRHRAQLDTCARTRAQTNTPSEHVLLQGPRVRRRNSECFLLPTWPS